MKTIATALMSACLALAAAGVAAQSTTAPGRAETDKDTSSTQMKQQCRDLMVSKKDGTMVKDKDPAAMTKMEAQCAEMAKNHTTTQKDMSTDTMKK